MWLSTLEKKKKSICPDNPNYLEQQNWAINCQSLVDKLSCKMSNVPRKRKKTDCFLLWLSLQSNANAVTKLIARIAKYIAQQNRFSSAGNLWDSLKGLFRWEKIGLEWVKNILRNAISAMLFILILKEVYLTVTPYAQWCCPQDDNSIL